MARTDNPERLPRERRLRAPAGTRLRAARFPLAITFVLLHLGWLVWDVPLVVTLAAFAVIAAVTAFAPRKAVVRRTRREERREIARWPDTSMKTIVNTVRNPAFLLDISGVVRFANAAAVRQFPETRPGDLLTLTFRSPQLVDAVREAAAGASSQVQYRERSDDTRLYSVEIDPVKRPGLTSEFLLVMFDDVSEQLALARMRSDFVANASHELRTPLASLTGFVETLLGPA